MLKTIVKWLKRVLIGFALVYLTLVGLMLLFPSGEVKTTKGGAFSDDTAAPDELFPPGAGLNLGAYLGLTSNEKGVVVSAAVKEFKLEGSIEAYRRCLDAKAPTKNADIPVRTVMDWCVGEYKNNYNQFISY